MSIDVQGKRAHLFPRIPPATPRVASRDRPAPRPSTGRPTPAETDDIEVFRNKLCQCQIERLSLEIRRAKLTDLVAELRRRVCRLVAARNAKTAAPVPDSLAEMLREGPKRSVVRRKTAKEQKRPKPEDSPASRGRLPSVAAMEARRQSILLKEKIRQMGSNRSETYSAYLHASRFEGQF